MKIWAATEPFSPHVRKWLAQPPSANFAPDNSAGLQISAAKISPI
jgi:hypothetical protein